MSKHTPGPWKYKPNAGYIVADIGTRIASILKNGGECQSNGCLIAAAPELLEACKMSLKLFEASHPYEANKLRDVINKAEVK